MPSLAPLYDLISYIPYAEEGELDAAAMSIDAGAGYGLRPADGDRQWGALAASLGLPAAETAERAQEMAEGLADAGTIDGLPHHQRASRQANWRP